MNSFQIASRLYDCRDAARTVLGESYPGRIQERGQVVRELATRNQCGVLEAGKQLAASAEAGMDALLTLAAVVELIEPSDEPADMQL